VRAGWKIGYLTPHTLDDLDEMWPKVSDIDFSRKRFPVVKDRVGQLQKNWICENCIAAKRENGVVTT
jgi:hypothetical protein